MGIWICMTSSSKTGEYIKQAWEPSTYKVRKKNNVLILQYVTFALAFIVSLLFLEIIFRNESLRALHPSFAKYGMRQTGYDMSKETYLEEVGAMVCVYNSKSKELYSPIAYFCLFRFLAHLALPKWAYIIMIHEMDPIMGLWFKLCGVCVVCVCSSWPEY